MTMTMWKYLVEKLGNIYKKLGISEKRNYNYICRNKKKILHHKWRLYLTAFTLYWTNKEETWMK